MMIQKPPLGIMPRKLWEEKRLDDLRQAITLFAEHNRPVPVEWVEEYNELLLRGGVESGVV